MIMDIGVKEVSHLLKVKEKTIYRWISSGEISFMRINRQHRFPRAQLIEWLIKTKSLSSTISRISNKRKSSLWKTF